MLSCPLLSIFRDWQHWTIALQAQ